MNGFNKRLRDSMMQAGLSPSPAVLAVKCGISRQTAKNWLSMEEPDMRGTLLAKLARCLNVRMVWLAEGRGPMAVPPQLEKLAEIATNLPPERLTEWIKCGERLLSKA